MEMDELLISTGVDSLIRLIKENKRIELAMAAKLLNLPQSEIEDWAHILEEEGIIKIDYQLTKVYFLWIAATEEEVSKEKEVFVARKGAVEEEVSKLENIHAQGERELAEYSAEIEKVSTKFAEKFAKVDEVIAKLEAQKGKRGTSSAGLAEKIDSLSTKIEEINSSIKDLNSQLKDTAKDLEGKGVESKLEGMKGAKARIKALDDKIDSLLSKVEDARKKVPKSESVDVGSIKTQFEELRARFDKSQEEAEYLRSIMGEFKVNAETVKDALGHIEDLSQTASRTKTELSGALSQIEKLKKDLPEIEKKLREDVAIADQYSETITVAKEVLQNVPAKEEVLKRLDAISEDEKSLSAEIKKLESTLSSVAGNVLAVGDLMDELSDMKEEVENSRNQLSEEADEILSSIDEETATYATFQKIKAKTKMAVDAYMAQLAKIREETKSASSELQKMREQSAAYLKEAEEGISPESASEALNLITSLQQKREDLDKIRAVIADLSARSSMIEKNIRLLSKEAQLISLREGEAQKGGKGAQGTQSAKEKEVGEKVSLTSSEQEEFELKRKELKDLIRKLWENE